MKWILQSSTQRVEILRSHECDSDDIPMEFRDRSLTLDFLRRLTHNPLNMTTLRSALAEIVPVMDISRLTDDEILQQFAWQIARRYFELVPRVEEFPHLVGLGTSSDADSGTDSSTDSSVSSGTDSADTASATETAAQAPAISAAPTDTVAPEEETDWIEFRVVNDETDLPMSNIGLKIKLSTGEIKDYMTDANGIVRIDDLPPGTCDIIEMTDPDAAEVVGVE